MSSRPSEQFPEVAAAPPPACGVSCTRPADCASWKALFLWLLRNSLSWFLFPFRLLGFPFHCHPFTPGSQPRPLLLTERGPFQCHYLHPTETTISTSHSYTCVHIGSVGTLTLLFSDAAVPPPSRDSTSSTWLPTTDPGSSLVLFLPVAGTSVQEPNCPFSPLPRVLCHVLSQGHRPLPPPPTTPGYRQSASRPPAPGASLCTQDKAQLQLAAKPLPDLLLCLSRHAPPRFLLRVGPHDCLSPGWTCLGGSCAPRAATEVVRGTDGSVLQRFCSTC